MPNKTVYASYVMDSITPIRIKGVDDTGVVVVHLTVAQAKEVHGQLGHIIEAAENSYSNPLFGHGEV